MWYFIVAVLTPLVQADHHHVNAATLSGLGITATTVTGSSAGYVANTQSTTTVALLGGPGTIASLTTTAALLGGPGTATTATGLTTDMVAASTSPAEASTTAQETPTDGGTSPSSTANAGMVQRPDSTVAIVLSLMGMAMYLN